VKSIVRFSVNNSLFVNLISVVIMIAGVICMFSLRREAFPNVNYDMVLVQTSYFGSSPSEIEKLITIDLEDELKEINGIDEMSSVSADNTSVIILELDPDEQNKSKIVNEIQRAVDRVELPEEAEDPIVNEVESKNFPVINISLSGDLSENELQNWARKLELEMLSLTDVARVDRTGWRDREIWVEVDPKKVLEYRLSLDDVILALKNKNMDVPGGTMTAGEKDYQVVTRGEFETPAQVENVIVRANDLGNWIKVKDVAKVKDTFEDNELIEKTAGERAITLTVNKKEKGDILRLVREIKQKVAQFEKGAPQTLNITYFDDFSFYVNRRLNVLKNNGIIGMIFLVTALLLTLTRTVAIVTALGIPTAIFLTFIFMYFTGMTLNLVTMFALIMILGMTVDDAIIICENVYRHMEMGKTPHEATIDGVSEVAKPVISVMLSTCVAFAPLFFMGGVVGKFIASMPIIVMITLFASLIESFLILPSHLADFVRKSGEIDKINKYRWYASFREKYLKVLTWVLGYRYKALGIFTGAIALVVILYVFGMRFVLFPQGLIEEFLIQMEAPVGTSLHDTSRRVESMEKLLAQLPKSELDNFITRVGAVRDGVDDPYAERGTHRAQIHVFLQPERRRGRRDVDKIIEQLRKDSVSFKSDFNHIAFDKVRAGPPVGDPVSIRLSGDDFKTLTEAAGKVKTRLEQIKGLEDARTDFSEGRSQIKVVVDDEKATQVGLTQKDIANTVRYVFDGGEATTIRKTDEQIDVIVRYTKEDTGSKDVFESIQVLNRFGNLVPLPKVAKLEETTGVDSIKHFDRKRTIHISATLDEKKVTPVEVRNIITAYAEKEVLPNYPSISMSFGGEQEETEKSMKDFQKSIIFALLMIFTILAANFNSLIRPVIVMSAIPFGIAGVVVAFFIHGQPLSFMAMLGTIGLTGIVVNDSIVLVNFIGNLRREGKGNIESIIEAAHTRIRPVILTTITTCVDLLPLAYGIGGRDPFLMPMALAIAWGLMFATVLTLLLVPCLYAISDDASDWLKKIRDDKKFPRLHFPSHPGK